MNIQNYTLGFVVCNNLILLIEKKKPEFQKGFYNGIGGKVEFSKNEDFIDCIVREAKEEANLNTTKEDWTHFCTMHCPNNSIDNISDSWMVVCFITIVNETKFEEILQREEEKLRIFRLEDINVVNSKLLGNITWLVGLGIDLYQNKSFVPPRIIYVGLSLPLKFK